MLTKFRPGNATRLLDERRCKTRRLFSLVTIAVGFYLLTSLPVLASTVTMNLDYDLNGSNAGQVNNLAYPTATFFDNGDGSVTLTMTNNSGADITDWYFNIDPTLDAKKDLTISYSSTSSSGIVPGSVGTATYHAGDGLYDIDFQFDAFGFGESATYILSGDGITANSFKFTSDPLNEQQTNGAYFYSAAKVGNDLLGATSAVPIPTTLLLLGSALLCLVGVRMKRKEG